jgi:hypothetical protein
LSVFVDRHQLHHPFALASAVGNDAVPQRHIETFPLEARA